MEFRFNIDDAKRVKKPKEKTQSISFIKHNGFNEYDPGKRNPGTKAVSFLRFIDSTLEDSPVKSTKHMPNGSKNASEITCEDECLDLRENLKDLPSESEVKEEKIEDKSKEDVLHLHVPEESIISIPHKPSHEQGARNVEVGAITSTPYDTGSERNLKKLLSYSEDICNPGAKFEDIESEWLQANIAICNRLNFLKESYKAVQAYKRSISKSYISSSPFKPAGDQKQQLSFSATGQNATKEHDYDSSASLSNSNSDSFSRR